MISEVIGLKGNQGAFVFGVYSFLDKIANGLLIFFILKSPLLESNDPSYIRFCIVFIPLFGSILALIMMLLG